VISRPVMSSRPWTLLCLHCAVPGSRLFGPDERRRCVALSTAMPVSAKPIGRAEVNAGNSVVYSLAWCAILQFFTSAGEGF
jgi:hypothetical protein